MDTQHVFWQLVKHDLKKRKRRNGRIPRQWWLIYLASIVFIVMVAITYGSLHGNMEITYTWYFAFGLPFATFGISIGWTVREWKNGTVGWWLSLSFSRRKLVASKFCAGLIRGLLILVIIFVAIALLALYTMLLNTNFIFVHYMDFLWTGLKWFSLLIAINPFMAALGVLYAVLSESRAKPILPLFWVFWSGIWWLVASTNGETFAMSSPEDFPLPLTLIFPIAASWIAVYLMILLAAYLLDRQLTL